MTKISNNIKIPFLGFVIALIYTTIFHLLDFTVVLLISFLLACTILVTKIKNTHKYLKIGLNIIIILAIFLIVKWQFYLFISTIISLLVSGVILMIINKTLYLPVKIGMTIILISMLCWIAMMITDLNKMMYFDNPIFAKVSNNLYGYDITYQGLGYKIYFKYGNENPRNDKNKDLIVYGEFVFWNKRKISVIS